MSHTCHAHGCTTSVSPKMLMCKKHWFSLPKPIQAAVWAEYRSGQEVDKRPSLRYLAVQQLAICRVAFKPYDEKAAETAFGYLRKSLEFRAEAIEAGLGDPLVGLLEENEASS